MRTRSTLLSALALVGLLSVAAEPRKPEKVLPTLEKRCQGMLEAQTAIGNGIAGLSREIATSQDKKATPAQQAAARELGKKQGAVADDVARLLKDLDRDGTAVFFCEVLGGLREDMLGVQRRLAGGDVGKEVQADAADAVATLKDMVRAITR